MVTRHKGFSQIDRGGRRRIRDRRFRASILKASNRRTGLKRRSGWDRRHQQLDIIKTADRRTLSIDPSTA